MAHRDILRVLDLSLQDFRCFTSKQINLDTDVSVIVGSNGSGKTSLVESFHYLCYLRSFRSSSPVELIRFDQAGFSVGASFVRSQDQQDITGMSQKMRVVFSGGKRIVRIGDRVIRTHSELRSSIAAMFITDDDVSIIRGGPHDRRTMLDRVIAMCDSTAHATLKDLKTIVDNRNALLRERRNVSPCETYAILTRQLWERSSYLGQKRVAMLEAIQIRIKRYYQQFFPQQPEPLLTYRFHKELGADSNSFLEKSSKELFVRESRYGRTLFGAQLDDVQITQKSHRSRYFSSRGQQKLLAVTIKIALADIVAKALGYTLPLILDDFMADFDEQTTGQLIDLLQTIKCQLIFTIPGEKRNVPFKLESITGSIIKLNS